MKPIQKYSSLFFIIGVLSLMFGLGMAYVNRGFSAVPVTLSILGALCLLIAALFILGILGKSFRALPWRKYALLTLLVFILVTGFAGINYLAIRANARLDLTRAKQHTLDPITIKTLKGLKQKVKISAFLVGIPPKYIEDMFSEYRRASSGLVETEVIDPLVQIGYAAQFGNVINAREKKIVVQSRGERKDVTYKQEDLLAEKDLTNAVIQVTRDSRKICFLAGHNEYDIDDKTGNGYSALKTLLENNNCTVTKALLASKKEIPADCDVLVIAGPKNPVPANDEHAIQAYLKSGGKALFLIESTPLATPDKPLSDQDKQKNPSMNSILNSWGLDIGDDLVVDMENYAGGDVGCPVTRNYPPHKEIVNNLDYTFYIRPRSISIAPTVPETVKIAPLVWTASLKNSWAEKSQSLEVKFDADKDTPGPIAIAVVVWEPKNDTKNKDTKLIVFANAEFAVNNFIDQYSNARIVLNSIGWLSELDTVMPIRDKDITVKKLELTSKQVRAITVILVAIPVLILAFGCLVWWRQKISS